MMIETAILVGVLVGAACYLVMRGSFVRVLFGFILLSNAANLFVLAMSGRPGGKGPPVLTPGGEPQAAAAIPVDPLPQALVLTAIVIGFGTTAYLVMLLYRIFLDQRTTNIHELYDPAAPTRAESPPGEGGKS